MGVNAPTLLRRASATSFTTTVELLSPLALPPLLPPPLLLPLLELLVVVVVVAALTKEVSRIVRISLQASEGSKSVECAA